MQRTFSLLCILCLFVLAGCASRTQPAPVVNGWQQPIAKDGLHVVVKGETLYSIAWMYRLDYHQLAKLNHLNADYDIYPGQKLRLVPPKHKVAKSPASKVKRKPTPVKKKVQVSEAKPVTKKKHAARKAKAKPAKKQYAKHISHWYWPAKGKIIAYYSSSTVGNKGINIAGRRGEAIRAAAAGKVVYRGDGISGYGNLIIIKHNSAYLSAYAHNQTILVKEGQWVKASQKIAEMGSTGSDRVMLHFEVRRYGKPVNPLKYLHKK